jgi:hypothetical protein
MNCTTCKYLEIANYIRPGDGICHRFPERPTISYPATDWCGEWKSKDPEPIAYYKGEPIYTEGDRLKIAVKEHNKPIDPVVIKLPARRSKKK